MLEAPFLRKREKGEEDLFFSGNVGSRTVTKKKSTDKKNKFPRHTIIINKEEPTHKAMASPKKSMYEFSTSPQPVASRRNVSLYRDSEPPGNILHDPRVVKGSTWSANARGEDSPSRSQAFTKPKSTQNKPTWSKKATESKIQAILKQCGRTPVDISANLVEQKEETTFQVQTTQTSNFKEAPPCPPYVPKKTGIDCSTQIEDIDNLFDFDAQVEPILDVIVSKTLEQALVEVRQEEELELLATVKAHYIGEKEKLVQLQKTREQEEIKKSQQKKVAIERQAKRLAKELLFCEKVAAVNCFRNDIGSKLQENVIQHLRDIEHFRDERKDAILNDFLPWVLDEVESRLKWKMVAEQFSVLLLQKAVGLRAEKTQAYHQAIQDRKDAQAEQLRQEQLRQEQLQQEALERARMERVLEKAAKAIKIFIQGESIFGIEGKLGPITLSLLDTVAEAEDTIHEWLVDNKPQDIPHFERPKDGYLALILQGGEIDPQDTESTLEFLSFIQDCIIDDNQS